MWNWLTQKTKETKEPQQNAEKAPAQADTDRINQELYRRNFELAIKNKTLQLLSELYKISTLTLSTEELARKLVYSVRTNLNYEIVGVFLLDKENENLFPTALTTSDQIKTLFHSLEDVYVTLKIPINSQHPFSVALKTSKAQNLNSFATLFTDFFKEGEQQKKLQELFTDTENLAVIVEPLISEEKNLGVLFMVINRGYEKIDTYERDALNTIAKVATIAIDKSRIYDQLTAANKHLKELDTAKSEFMSIASHQLRTPLAGMMGYLSMLLGGDYGDINKDQKQVLDDISSAGQRLTRLVNAFLNATRIEAGRLTVNYTKVPFNDIIESMYKELKPTADKKKVTLTFKSNPKLPELEVDSDKLKDVALNLIDNAIKYSPGATVTIWGEKVDDNTVRFVSQDTGVGIPAGQAPGLFNKFVRGSGIAQVEPNGSGLGLFIAKKIIEAHGGRIWAESEGENKGSKFQFEVPIHAANLPVMPGAGAQALNPVTNASAQAAAVTAGTAPQNEKSEAEKKYEAVSPATAVKDGVSNTESKKSVSQKPKAKTVAVDGIKKTTKKKPAKKAATKAKPKKK